MAFFSGGEWWPSPAMTPPHPAGDSVTFGASSTGGWGCGVPGSAVSLEL